MGSVASINPGLADLFQNLSSANSSLLSSPALLSALGDASPTDFVSLSAAATQLQSVDAILGISSTSSSSSPDLNSLLANIVSTLTGSDGGSSGAAGSTGTDGTPSLAQQLATYKAAFQTSEIQTLLGIDPAGGSTGSLFNFAG